MPSVAILFKMTLHVPRVWIEMRLRLGVALLFPAVQTRTSGFCWNNRIF